MSDSTKQASSQKFLFVVSDDKSPTVVLKPGMKVEVHSVQLVEPSLKASKTVKATLCGGSKTCVAIVNIQ